MLSEFAVLTRGDREGSMEDRFDKLVVIEDRRRVGSQRNVGSVREAAECLVGIHWPRPGGAHHRAAAEVCLQAMAGEILPEAARQAFMEAAREAGILIGEAPVPGGQQTEGSTQELPAHHHEPDHSAVSKASRAERGDEPFSPIRDILMVVLLPTVIIMALVAAVVVVFGGL
jgi:Protein of unknown function (DUF982)